MRAELDDASFGRWALRVFRWQVTHNPAYAIYCERRGVTLETVRGWRDVPPVPTAAFKRLRLLSLEEGQAPEAVFRTSGTSRGRERRGEHPVASLALYRASLLPNFRAHLLPDDARLSLLALVPDPAHAPDSSLGYMIGAVMDRWGAEGSAWCARPDGAPDQARFLAALEWASAKGRPVLVATTAFALVHALDGLVRAGRRLRLPEGSRLLETGGFKGRVRDVSRQALYEGVTDRLGVPHARIVNEYGMTELLSQFYEPVLSVDAGEGGGDLPLERRFHVSPPWVRTRVLDPVTLEPVSSGSPGLLCHFDLANAGSVACVLTEDMGIGEAGGFRLLGRAPGAEPRGCSLATEALLEAAASS